MTRQKKELIGKIERAHRFIETDEFLMRGCGAPAPDGFYKPIEDYIDRLQEQLAGLRHYRSFDEMLLDTRGFDNIECELPFI